MISIQITNHAGDTASYAYDFDDEKVIKLLWKNIDMLFDWFSDNFLKANPDKVHLLINND